MSAPSDASVCLTESWMLFVDVEDPAVVTPHRQDGTGPRYLTVRKVSVA